MIIHCQRLILLTGKRQKNRWGFLRAYKMNRERMGLPVYPKLTSECFLVFREDLIKEKWKAGQELTRNEEEYLKTEQCFVYAFSAIMHPYRPEMTERRRRVFFIVIYMVYLFHWLASESTIKKNIIVDDSKMAMMQFALALDLLVFL